MKHDNNRFIPAQHAEKPATKDYPPGNALGATRDRRRKSATDSRHGAGSEILEVGFRRPSRGMHMGPKNVWNEYSTDFENLLGV
jgi:hypothetical protein